MGESFGPYKKGLDEELLEYVTSANVACGFHAGDPSTIRETVQMALDKNVAVGAHPGLQDLVGFGRRKIEITPKEAYDIMVYQIGALQAFVHAEGGKLQHVKPHGALYNMAAKDSVLSEAIAEAVYKVNPELILYGLSGGELIEAGERIGLRTASEVFADRTYQEDGSLTDRSDGRALITNATEAVKQVTRMVIAQQVNTVQNNDISIKAETICIHGDGRNALKFAAYIREALQEAGIEVKKMVN